MEKDALNTTPTTLDAVTNEAVCAVVINAEALTQDADTAVTGINDNDAAYDAVSALPALFE